MTKAMEQKKALTIYDFLREAHKNVHAIQQKFNLRDWPEQKNAIDAVNSVLYMAETIFIEKIDK